MGIRVTFFVVGCRFGYNPCNVMGFRVQTLDPEQTLAVRVHASDSASTLAILKGIHQILCQLRNVKFIRNHGAVIFVKVVFKILFHQTFVLCG